MIPGNGPEGDIIVVVAMTPSVKQALRDLTGQDSTHQLAGGAVEVRFRKDGPVADLADCQVVILQPGEGLTYLLADKSGTGPRSLATERAEYAGVWSTLGHVDEEEPTWEDAAWQ